MRKTITARRATMSLSLIVMGAMMTFAGSAQAATLFWDGTGANDTIDWGQLGPTGTIVSSGAALVSNGGLGAMVTDSVGDMERRDQNAGWSGNFGAGERLLWNRHDGTLTINFVSPVRAAGAQIQSNFYGAFTARATTNDGSFFDVAGFSSVDADDTSPFLGIISDTQNITSIAFNIEGDTNDFAIGQLDLIGGDLGAVPEPSTWAMMLLGFFAVGGTMRSARRRQKLSLSYS